MALEQCHSKMCGGHFLAKTITTKVFHVAYYFPSLHQDAHLLVQKCEAFQHIIGKQKLIFMPLKPIKVQVHFTRWGMYFIGPISPPSSVGNIFILTIANYSTKWEKILPLRNVEKDQMIESIKDNFLLCFGTNLRS
jgi:hypothetical protein